jgi:hypothetical protein
LSKCPHDGLIAIRHYVSGWEDYLLDRQDGSSDASYSDGSNKFSRIGKTGICDQCNRRVKLTPAELA